MTLPIQNGQLIVVGGQLALSQGCCCCLIPPVARFYVVQTAGTPNITIDLVDSSTPSSAECIIDEWEWRIDDVLVSTDQNPVGVNLGAGGEGVTWEIELTIRDTCGCEDVVFFILVDNPCARCLENLPLSITVSGLPDLTAIAPNPNSCCDLGGSQVLMKNQSCAWIYDSVCSGPVPRIRVSIGITFGDVDIECVVSTPSGGFNTCSWTWRLVLEADALETACLGEHALPFEDYNETGTPPRCKCFLTGAFPPGSVTVTI